MEAVALEADAADAAVAAPALEEVVGDLLEAMEQYIVQQSNCVTSYAHGLAKAIEEKFPHADVYKPAVRTLRRAKWWLRWLSWERFDLKCLKWWSIMEYHWGMWDNQEGIWLVTTVRWGVNAPLTKLYLPPGSPPNILRNHHFNVFQGCFVSHIRGSHISVDKVPGPQ